jgi:uncharacterized protein DUF4157
VTWADRTPQDVRSAGRRGAEPSRERARPPEIVTAPVSEAGEPLSEPRRAFFESRLGHDFGAVRVHAGPAAAGFAGSLGARAVTVGTDIFTRDGPPQDDNAGRLLLAHELGHVVQHRQAPSARPVPVDAPDSGAEHEAAAAAQVIARGEAVPRPAAVPTLVAARWTDDRLEFRSPPVVA